MLGSARPSGAHRHMRAPWISFARLLARTSIIASYSHHKAHAPLNLGKRPLDEAAMAKTSVRHSKSVLVRSSRVPMLVNIHERTERALTCELRYASERLC
jgi:hypothetical protein